LLDDGAAEFQGLLEHRAVIQCVVHAYRTICRQGSGPGAGHKRIGVKNRGFTAGHAGLIWRHGATGEVAGGGGMSGVDSGCGCAPAGTGL
jgi:hypothetical protein